MLPPAELVICHLACAPMRAGPSHVSEQSHQLLFGECCQILEAGPLFARARSLFEGYEGWIDLRQFRAIATPPPAAGTGSVLSDEIVAVATSKERTLWLPLGSLLPGYHEGTFALEEETFHFQGAVHRVRPLASAYELVAYAFRYLHAPYLWGARSPLGIDCSGLTQMVFRAFGITLLRDATQQQTQGHVIPDLSAAQPGDLAFLKGLRHPGATIDHVGIIFPGGQILHASGCVRLDQLDEAGIWQRSCGEQTHRLVEIRRVANLIG